MISGNRFGFLLLFRRQSFMWNQFDGLGWDGESSESDVPGGDERGDLNPQPVQQNWIQTTLATQAETKPAGLINIMVYLLGIVETE